MPATAIRIGMGNEPNLISVTPRNIKPGMRILRHHPLIPGRAWLCTVLEIKLVDSPRGGREYYVRTERPPRSEVDPNMMSNHFRIRPHLRLTILSASETE